MLARENIDQSSHILCLAFPSAGRINRMQINITICLTVTRTVEMREERWEESYELTE